MGFMLIKSLFYVYFEEFLLEGETHTANLFSDFASTN